MKSLRVVVTGGNGVLGRAIALVRPQWATLSRAQLDVRNAAQVLSVLRDLHPDVVVHAAALTDHQHPDAAEVIATNVIGTQNVADVCNRLNIPLVYTSTHYVYEGVTGNYDENAIPRPIGAYAMSKLAGERAVASTLPYAHLIVRGSWYTRETRLDRWAKRGALINAYCSRESAAQAARKLIALVEAGVRGAVNIGGPRRSFSAILLDEGYSGFQQISRAMLDFDRRYPPPPYLFPIDVSVSTAKFDALRLTLP